MSDVTRILSRIESSDPSVADQMLPLVYDELWNLAAARQAQEKPGQTLQATALVHDAYARATSERPSAVIARNSKWSHDRDCRAWWQRLLLLFVAAINPFLLAELSARPPSNAAQSYRRAYAEVDELLEATGEIPESAEPLPTASEFAHWDKQHEQVFFWLRQATEAGECDWQNDLQRKGAAAVFPHLAQARELARRAIFRARFNWHGKQREQAIADLRCVIILARRIGDEGRTGLVGLIERYKMEQTVVDLVNNWLVDSDSAQRLDPLFRLALQPDLNLPKKGLLLEREMLVPWMRRLVRTSDLSAEQHEWRRQFVDPLSARRGVPWILQKLDETESQYEQVGELLELRPADFGPRFRDYLARLDGAGNPFSQTAIVECPGIPGTYWQSRKLRTEWTMLQTAAVVFQHGPEFAKKTRDPYGDGAFALSESPHGFTLRSELILEGTPVTLDFKRNPEIAHSHGSADPNSNVGADRSMRRMGWAIANKDLAALRFCFARSRPRRFTGER